jgi:hypothetical protein
MVEEAKVNVHVRDDYGLDGSPWCDMDSTSR